MYAADPPSKHGYMVMKSPTAKSLIAVVALLAAMTFAKARSTPNAGESGHFHRSGSEFQVSNFEQTVSRPGRNMPL
jgi:hypothetical protein